MDIPENSINEILETDPSQGTLYALLTIMKENGRLKPVIEECLKALSRFPDDLKLRKILAEAYLEDGRLLEAEAQFGRIIDGMKELAGVYRSQAEIFVRQKREDDAVNSLKHYLAFFPDNEEAALLLEELRATEEDVAPVELPGEQVATDILEAQEQEELTEIITASLAETYFNQERYAEAREIYEKLVEKNPEDTVLKMRLDEISALTEPKVEPEDLQIENKIRQKKEKMISVLDTWRNNIRELAEEGVSG